jgi:DNA-binding MarR family transcriptional regulator
MTHPSKQTPHEEALDVEVLKQFRVIFKSVRKHFQSVEDALGISGAQLWALSCIAEKPGIRVTELARAMTLHQSTTSNLIEKLADLDLVRRERSSADGRIITLYPTESGTIRLEGAPAPVRGLLPDALGRLPYNTLRDLHRSLETLLGTMGNLEESAGESTPLSDV